MVWVKFIVCIIIIFFSGKRVAKYGDIIADKTGLGGVWTGLILIALVTSLPELFTGISAILIVDAPDLTIGDILGANAFNLFNLALLDIIRQNGSILTAVSSSHRLTGWASFILVSIVAASVFISHHFFTMSLGWIGWYTPIIIALYLLSLRKIYLSEQGQPSTPKVTPGNEKETAGRVYLHFTISAVFIIGAGIWLAIIGDEIATVTGWGGKFVGSLLLAFTTSLPEITVSIIAMRIGATDMAVANMIGSNLFNITIIPVTDMLYRKSPILAAVSPSHLVTASAVALMTLLFIAGLHLKPKRRFRLSWWNCIMVTLFLLSAYFSFTLA